MENKLKIPISKLLTPHFRGNPAANTFSGLGMSMLLAAFTLRNETEFAAEFVRGFALTCGTFCQGVPIFMWRRTALYYFKTIRIYKEMKKRGVQGDLIKRLENFFKNTPDGCKSFGVMLAIKDLEKYESLQNQKK